MRDERWPAGAYAAEFADEHEFVRAVLALREQGYDNIETYTPYPVALAHESLPEPPSPLPLLVFLAGLGGAVVSYWVQWFANVVSYPLNIGGRPTHAAPAFFIPTFEGTVFAAAVTAFAALLVLLRLPRPWHPMFEVDEFERASIDHYWVAIDASDRHADPERTPRVLQRLAPIRVVRVEAT